MASKDVALNIIADIADYQKGMAKIPGVTQKQAAAAAMRMQRELSKGQKKAAKAATKAADQSSQAWKTAGAQIAGALSVAAIGAAVKGLAGFVGGVVSTVDEINTLGKATGLSNETIAGLAQAAKATGKELSDLVPTDLSKKMLQAANGSIKAERSFAQLGVKATDSSGKLRSADDVFRDVIDSLGTMEDGTAKAALASDLLGAQGRQLLSAFESSDGLDAFVDQASTFGIDVGPDAVAAAGEWQSATAELGLAFNYAKQQAVNAMGGFDGIAASLGNFTTGLVFAGEFIKVFSGEILTKMGQQVAAVAAVISGDWQRAAKLFDQSTGFDAVADTFDKAAVSASVTTHELLTLRAATKKTSDAAADGTLDLAGYSAAEKEAAAEAKKFAKSQEAAAKSVIQMSGSLKAATRETVSDQLDAEGKVLAAYRKRRESLGKTVTKLAELKAAGVDTADAEAAANVLAGEISQRAVRDLAAVRAAESAADTERDLADSEAANELKDSDAQKETERRAELVAQWGEAVDIVASFGNTALGALSELNARQGAAAAEALADARGAVVEMKGQRRELAEQILAETDEVKKAALMADLVVLDSSLKRGKAVRKAARKAARDNWKSEKAIAISGVVFNTGVAALKAYAMYGPPPSPAGIAASAAAVTAGAVQVGMIATSPPPQFHAGLDASTLGGLTAAFTRTPDERLASLTPDESVLNGRAGEALGAGGVSQLNATGQLGGGGGAVLAFEGRHIDELFTRTVARGGGARRMISTVARSRSVGQIPILQG